MLLAPAAFSASLAESPAVSERSFDWIFFVIVGIPFLIALVGSFNLNLLERFVRDWPWERRGSDADD
jgi:hypothetical protein